MQYLVGALAGAFVIALLAVIRDLRAQVASQRLTSKEAQQDDAVSQMRREYEAALHDYDSIKPDGKR